jgi:hemolysin D
MWLILLLFGVGLAWSYYGEVDIVVTAPGRVVPSGQVKRVQVPEAGVISVIHVTEGETVRAGQPLVSLDPAYAGADSARLIGQLEAAEVELLWRRVFDRWLDDPARRNPDVGEILSLELPHQSTALRMLRQHQREYTATTGAFESDLEANQSEQAAIKAQMNKANASLTVLGERVAAYKTLVDKQYGSRVQYLEPYCLSTSVL